MCFMLINVVAVVETMLSLLELEPFRIIKVLNDCGELSVCCGITFCVHMCVCACVCVCSQCEGIHYSTVTGILKCNPQSRTASEWQRRDPILNAIQSIHSKHTQEEQLMQQAQARSKQQTAQRTSKHANKRSNADDKDDDSDIDEDLLARGFLFGTGTITASANTRTNSTTTNTAVANTHTNMFTIHLLDIMRTTNLRREEVTKGLYHLQNRGSVSYQLTNPLMFLSMSAHTHTNSLQFPSVDAYTQWIHDTADKLFAILQSQDRAGAERALKMWQLGSILASNSDDKRINDIIEHYFKEDTSKYPATAAAEDHNSDSADAQHSLGWQTLDDKQRYPLYTVARSNDPHTSAPAVGTESKMQSLSVHRQQTVHVDIQLLVHNPSLQAIVKKHLTSCIMNTKQQLSSQTPATTTQVKALSRDDVVSLFAMYIVKCLHGVSTPTGLKWSDWKEHSAWGKYKDVWVEALTSAAVPVVGQLCADNKFFSLERYLQ
jgi:hypothetical protein